MALNLNVHVGSFVSRLALRRCCYRLYSADTKLQTTEGSDTPEVVVPYRIPRGPTDILRALESTLKKDYTAPKQKYVDDPYFIPISNIMKRSFALSKESGKKAARYFLEKYPEIFSVHKSEPLVKAFQPPLKFTENDEVSEKTLLSCIKSIDVANCIAVYELLVNKGISLEEGTKQQLLELLCFYNSTVPPRDEYYEEKWFSIKDEFITKNTWLNSGLAEKLFQDMDKTSASYCAMIQGTAKYGHGEKSFLLYEEMREKGLPATLETYNSLLTMIPRIIENGNMRWEYAMNLVQNMNSEGFKPNLHTMNALMSIISMSARWDKGRSIALQVLAEMGRLNIEPSLGTYYYLLNIFYKNFRGFVSILPQIMDKLEGKELEIRHPADVLFFHTAMTACCKGDNNKDLAYQLNAYLERGNNYKFLASAFYESVYFKHFFKLLSYAEDFDKFMQIYERYVPNTYTPEPSVTFDVITALDFNGAYKYLTKIFSDVILFEQTEREDILTELFRVSANVKLDEQDQELLMRLTWSVVEKIDRRAENRMRKSVQWTGALLGNVIKICLNGKDLEKSWVVMQRLKNEEFSIIGYPDDECLVAFCTQFLEAKEFKKVAFCVRYAMDVLNHDMKPIVTKIVADLVEKKLLDDEDREEFNKVLDLAPEDDENVKNGKQDCEKEAFVSENKHTEKN